MFHLLKIIASTIAIILAITAYGPYFLDMIRGKSHPHLYTWISIVLVTSVVGYIQLAAGGGIGAIPTLLGAAIDVIILVYCFRYGTKDVVFTDKLCLAASIIGVVAYLVLHDKPVISLAIVTAAEVISFVPTFRKTHNDPYSESLPSYYLLILKLTLILVALQKYNLLTVSYSVLWIIIFVVFLTATWRWRQHVTPPVRETADTSVIVV
jgi:hypothetical protein